MAKEQKRGNREFKKPKKVREPVSEAAPLSNKAVLERIAVPKKQR